MNGFRLRPPPSALRLARATPQGSSTIKATTTAVAIQIATSASIEDPQVLPVFAKGNGHRHLS